MSLIKPWYVFFGDTIELKNPWRNQIRLIYTAEPYQKQNDTVFTMPKLGHESRYNRSVTGCQYL